MIKGILFIFAVMTLLPGIGMAAQTFEESTQNAARIYSDWIAVIVDITRGVEVQERDVRKELWGILIKAKAKADEGTRTIKDIDINELKEIVDQLLRVAGRAGE